MISFDEYMHAVINGGKMKKYMFVFIVLASFFVCTISYAVRTFTKDDAFVQEKTNVTEAKGIKPDAPGKNFDEPGMKGEEDKDTSIPEEAIDSIPENVENENIHKQNSEVGQEGYKEMIEKDKQMRENANKPKDSKDSLIKPKIDGSGDYKTF
jgi:hypothetical protein